MNSPLSFKSLWALGVVVLLFVLSSTVFAQDKNTNTPIDYYKHLDVVRAENTTIQEFGRNQFLESVVSGADGSIYTTNLFQGIVYRIKDGKVTKLFQHEGTAAGLTLADDNHLMLTATSKKEGPVVFQIILSTGEAKIAGRLADAAMLNGIVKVQNHTYLIADSFKGIIWKLDTKTGATSQWLNHELFRAPSFDGSLGVGVNGLKPFKGAIYASNTTNATLIKIPVHADGAAGTPSVFLSEVFMDDFDMDSEGNFYAAPHMYDCIVKISPEGKKTIIAQSDQGINGSTCVTFVHGTENTILVSTNGGMTNESKKTGYITPAKILQLKLK